MIYQNDGIYQWFISGSVEKSDLFLLRNIYLNGIGFNILFSLVTT